MTVLALRLAPPTIIIRPAVVYAVLFASIGASFPYVAVFLQSAGLPLELVGLFIGLNALVSVIAAPVWGSLADGLGDVRRLLLAGGVASAAIATIVGLASDPLVIGLAMAALGAAGAGLVPLTDSRTIQMIGSDRNRYGQARAGGSAAFIASALVTGALVAALGIHAMFLVYVPTVVLTGIAAWNLLGDSDAATGGSPRARSGSTRLRTGLGCAGRILGVGRLGALLGGSMLVWTAVAAVTNFAPIHLIALGADAGTAGLVFALGAAVEVPLMLLFPILAQRYGAASLVVAGALAFALRAAALAMAQDISVALLAAPISGIGFALFYVGTVSYIAGIVRPDAQATAQSLFTGTAFSAGAVTGSVIGGAVAASLSLPALFAIAAGATMVGALVVRWAVRGAGASVPAARPIAVRSSRPAPAGLCA